MRFPAAIVHRCGVSPLLGNEHECAMVEPPSQLVVVMVGMVVVHCFFHHRCRFRTVVVGVVVVGVVEVVVVGVVVVAVLVVVVVVAGVGVDVVVVPA